MYLNHWGLDSPPFGASADVFRFYPGPTHDEALARIEFLVRARRRLGLLLGAAGSGKSLLMRVAAGQLQRQAACAVVIDAFGLTAREFLWQLADGLGATPGHVDDLPRLWRKVADRIAENRQQQLSTVLLVDDADAAGADLVTQLVRLTRLDPLPECRWTMVLAAPAERAQHWPPALRQRVDLRIDLGPWPESATIGFLQTALVEAGCVEPIFAPPALSLLHELTDGNPRNVTRLAECSLSVGAETGVEAIDVDTVQSAATRLQEMSLTATV